MSESLEQYLQRAMDKADLSERERDLVRMGATYATFYHRAEDINRRIRELTEER